MATTIKELLDKLSEDDRRVLSYAFEHELSQYVVFEGRYIGVNLDGHPGLVDPDMKAGVYSSGPYDVPKDS